MADLDSLQKKLASVEGSLRELLKTTKDQSAANTGLLGNVTKLTSGFSQLGTVITSLGAALGAGLGLKELEISVAKNNKTLYDLSRNTKIVGGNFKDLKTNIDVLSKTTLMSRQQAAEFATTLQKGTLGIRMTGAEMAKVGQIMSSEWGGSIDDINNSTQKLISLQNKNVTLFKDMSKGMSDAAFQDYVYALEDMAGATGEEIDELVRFRNAAKGAGSQIDAETASLRELGDAQQKAQKSAQDLQLAVGKQMEDQFKKTHEVVAKMNDTLKAMAEGFPTVVKGIGYVALAIGGLATAIGTITALKGAGNMLGSVGGGILDKAKGLLGKKVGGAAGAAQSLLGGVAGSAGIGGDGVRVFVTNFPGGGLPGTGGPSAPGGPASRIPPGAGGSGAAGGMGAAGKVGILYAAIAAASAIYTGVSEERSRAQDLQLTERGTLENVVHMFNPLELGSSIGAAIRGTFEDAPVQRKLGEGLNQDAYAKFEAGGGIEGSLKRRQTPEWKKANEEARKKQGLPPLLEKGAVPDASKQKEVTKSAEEERQIRLETKALLQFQHKMSEAILSSNMMQLDYMARYKGDLTGATKLIDEMKVTTESDVKLAEKVLALTIKNEPVRLKELEARKKNAEKMAEGVAKDEELLAIEIAVNTVLGKRATAQKELTAAQKSRLDLSTQEIKLKETEKELEQGRMAIAESELSLAKNLYMGLGPTIDAQNKVLDSIEKQRNINQQQLDLYEKMSAVEKAMPENIKLRNKLELDQVNLRSKELELTKSLREGYLDAMGAFTNVSGAFSKIITTQEQSAGTAIKFFKAASSMRKGGTGGYDTPVAGLTKAGVYLNPDDGSVGGRKEAAGWTARGRATPMSGVSDMHEAGKEQVFGEGGKAALGQSTDLKGAINNNTKAIEEKGTTANPTIVKVIGGTGGGGTGAGALTGEAKTTIAPGKPSLTTSDFATAEKKKAEVDKAKAEAEAKMTNEQREAIKKDEKQKGQIQQENNRKIKKEIEAIDPASKAKKRVIDAEKQLIESRAKDEKAKQQAIVAKRTGMETEIKAGPLRQKEVESAYAEMGKVGPAYKEAWTKKASLAEEKKNIEAEIKDAKELEALNHQKAEQQGQMAKVFEAKIKHTFDENFNASSKIREKQLEYSGKAFEQEKKRKDLETKKIEIVKQIQINEKKHIETKSAFDAASIKQTDAIRTAEKKLEKYKTELKGPITVDAGPSKATVAAQKESRDASADIMNVMKDEFEKNTRRILVNPKIKELLDNENAQRATALDVQNKALEAEKVNIKKGQEITAAQLAENKKGSKASVDKNNADIELAKQAKQAERDLMVGVASGNAPIKEATGGFVPGTGNKDSVPALLMPGEFVMNKKSTQKYGWLMDSLNKNRFAAGGLVGGGLSGGAALDAGGGGGSPRFAINIKGDSAGKISKMLMDKVHGQLNKLLMPSGSTGRMFDQTNNG